MRIINELNIRTNDKKPEFQFRAILFIDLLGFKSAIDKSVDDEELFKKIHSAVNSLYRAKDENYKGPLLGKDFGVEISVFSDSLVISKDLNDSGSFYYLLNIAYFTIIEILSSGFLARGAITIGKLYHNKKVIFGPAINNAYLLESKCAIYPRVIVEKEIVEKMLLENHLNEIDEERKWYEKLLKEDEDGLQFIDFLSPYHQFDDFEEYCWLLGKIKELILTGMNSDNNLSVRQKYIWLKNYFNNTLDQLIINSESLPTKII